MRSSQKTSVSVINVDLRSISHHFRGIVQKVPLLNSEIPERLLLAKRETCVVAMGFLLYGRRKVTRSNVGKENTP